MPIAKKDLIHLGDLTTDEIWQVLRKGQEMKEILRRDDKKYPILRGKSVMRTVPEPVRLLNLRENIWEPMW